MPYPEHFAPVGNYSLKFINVPTFRADRTVTVTPPEEYINPEFIVNPGGVKLLIDDRGDPAYSTDAYNIVQEEKHKPLNPYQGYLEDKGVAPKDNEVEHLLQRQRADDAAERSDLSPFFANLMTGMYASAAQQGVEDIKNGKYITGISELASPLMFGENAWNNVAQAIYGGIHLLNDNGVRKTWNEIKNGNYGSAALSGAGDLFNLALLVPGLNTFVNNNLKGIKVARALNKDIKNTKNLNEYSDVSNNSDLITKVTSPNGVIRLRLPSHTKSAPREFTLEPQGNNKYYVHMRIWDDVDNHIPGDITNAEKQKLFEALYNELPDGAEILLPKSSPEYYATRGTIAGLQRLKKDPRFIPGTQGTVYYIDKDRTIKTYVGSSFIKKQSRMFSEGTYPIYTGPKHSISEVVNADGTVNPRAAMHIQHEVADYFKQFGKDAYKMEERLENPEWHPTDVNTFLHTKNVATSAWKYPPPEGMTKQDQMVAALGHDFGKMVAGDGHGEIGAALIKQIFPDATPEQIAAIAEHMSPNPSTELGWYTKMADIMNGRTESYTIGTPKGIGTIQPRQGHISLQPSTNPLQIRLQRLKTKSIEDYDPAMQKILTKPVIRGNDVRKTFKELAPDLTDEQLDIAVQIAFANKRDVHIPIGDSVTAETTGGVSIVDIENAVKYLRESGIANPTPTDVGIIAGHEAGHGVKVTDEALNLVRNYYAPEEFYTQAGQILDAAGVVDTSEPITYNQFMYMLEQYNQNKNLNNGIDKLKDFMQNLSLIDRQKVMKNINRFSVGLLGMYGLKQLKNNGKVQ